MTSTKDSLKMVDDAIAQLNKGAQWLASLMREHLAGMKNEQNQKDDKDQNSSETQ